MTADARVVVVGGGVVAAAAAYQVRSSGFCVDPIEKKPLDHFLPGPTVLSFGAAGCNLGCRYYLQHALNFQVHDVKYRTSLGGKEGRTSDGGGAG